MTAQKATEIRRLVGDVEADAQALRRRQRALEEQLVAAPAASWVEAAGKARYLLGLFASTPAAEDPRPKTRRTHVRWSRARRKRGELETAPLCANASRVVLR